MINSEFEKAVEEVMAKYQPELDAIKDEGEELGEEVADPNAFEAVIDTDFKIEWVDTKLSMDIPSVTMTQRDISFDLPEIKMKRKKISFDVVEMKMETYCVAKVPQGFPPKLKCLKADKPVFKKVRREISTDLPSVKMKTKKISLHIPEISMRTQEIVLTLPQITVTSVSASIRKAERKAKSLDERARSVSSAMESELQALVGKFFGDGTDAETDERRDLESRFDHAIAELSKSISELSAQDIDPSKVPAKGGNINLRKLLSDLVDRKEDALDRFDTAMETAVN